MQAETGVVIFGL